MKHKKHWLIRVEEWVGHDEGNHVFLFSLPRDVIEQVGWKRDDNIIWEQSKTGYTLYKAKTKSKSK